MHYLTEYLRQNIVTVEKSNFHPRGITVWEMISSVGCSPIPDTMLSICCRFFRYIGQTCPSKYPGGSGGVYTRELSITDRNMGQDGKIFIYPQLVIKRKDIHSKGKIKYYKIRLENKVANVLMIKSVTFASFCRHHMVFPWSIFCQTARSEAWKMKSVKKLQFHLFRDEMKPVQGWKLHHL